MLLKLLSLALVCACSGPQPRSCAFAGDAARPIELQAIALDAAGNAAPVSNGGPLLLERPPQGGFVVFAGARARNLRPCNVQMAAELVDPASGKPVSELSSRGADLVDAVGGYLQPAHDALRFELPNIAACRDLSGAGVLGRRLLLRVDVTDSGGRHARIDQPVVPACPQGDSGCASSCGG
jgi:hypothetical protein